MSEHLTHIAVFEDCGRLALASPEVTKAFKQSLRKAWDVGLVVSAARGNHLFAVPMLEECRALWPRRTRTDDLESLVSAALGWISHRAADLQMKPLSRKLKAELAKGAPNPHGLDPSEYQVYQDAVTFREVYGGGTVQPGTPFEPLAPATLEEGLASHPAARVGVAQLEPLLAARLQADLLALQAFTRREGAHDGRSVDAVLERRQAFTEPLSLYVEAYQRPSPVKSAQYIESINWYDARDPVIAWARALQRREKAPAVPLAEAIAAAKEQSHYAQALHRGMAYLFAASEFFDDRRSKASLYDVLEIWPPDHRAMKVDVAGARRKS